jgi:tripartite-type tricarboxylate transporter receptor subunit TctC
MTLSRRALGATLLLPAVARAQGAFPSRPVRIVVPFPPGGGLDALGRALAEQLAAAWGQPVVIENRPGGATVPGTDAVAKAGVQLTHVPYRGLTPAVVATLANEVQMTLAGVASSRQHLEAGNLRALAVGRPTRLPQLPEVPTLAEAGHNDIDPRTWFGILAPAGTPPATVRAIRDAIAAAMAAPAVRDRHLTPNGYTVHVSSPEDFAAMIARDMAVKRDLIRRAGISPD